MKNQKKGNKCNICGGPQWVNFTEKDEESGQIKEKSHYVLCLGHSYIKPHLWNHHPDFDKYRMLKAKQRQISEASNE